MSLSRRAFLKAAAALGRAAEALEAVYEFPFLARCMNCHPHDALGGDPPEQLGGDQGAVLDAVARRRPRTRPQGQVERLQHHVDGHIPVGVDADLKAEGVGAADGLVQPLLGGDEDAVVVGPADVQFAHPHRPLRRAAVAEPV